MEVGTKGRALCTMTFKGCAAQMLCAPHTFPVTMAVRCPGAFTAHYWSTEVLCAGAMRTGLEARLLLPIAPVPESDPHPLSPHPAEAKVKAKYAQAAAIQVQMAVGPHAAGAASPEPQVRRSTGTEEPALVSPALWHQASEEPALVSPALWHYTLLRSSALRIGRWSGLAGARCICWRSQRRYQWRVRVA